VQDQSISEPRMVLSNKSRYTEKTLVSGSFFAGVHIGFRKFILPNLSFRLGLLWVILDPLLKAMVFAFLIMVIRGNISPTSLIVGVFTIGAQNATFSRSMKMRLSNEPFPLTHTPDAPLLTSMISSELFTAIFLGISGASLLILVADAPILLLPALSISCCSLAIIFSGSGLLLSPINLVIKDFGAFVGHILRLGFFLQCVLYPYSMTSGLHRSVLYWLPHTILVEWCRSIASGTSSPFSISHSLEVILIWSIPMIIGFVRFKQYRWRSTTWS